MVQRTKRQYSTACQDAADIRWRDLVRRLCAGIFIGFVTIACSIDASKTYAQALGQSQDLPRIGSMAPAYALPDTKGRIRKSSDFRGQKVVLFFFCGCSWCADVAREWSSLQKSGVLNSDTERTSIAKKGAPGRSRAVTLVIYSGEAAEAENLRKMSGLLKETVIMCDPELAVTEKIFHADPCPRVFVLRADGKVLYTNRGADDAPRTASATLIVAKSLNALRAKPNTQ